MAIDSSLVFDRIKLYSVGGPERGMSADLFNGDTVLWPNDGVTIPRYPWNTSDPEIAEIISRIVAGTCSVEFSTPLGTSFPTKIFRLSYPMRTWSIRFIRMTAGRFFCPR